MILSCPASLGDYPVPRPSLPRHVFLYVFGSPEGGEAVDRLEKELGEHLRQHGGSVPLPEFRCPEHIPWFEP
jgi:hypothetical protein